MAAISTAPASRDVPRSRSLAIAFLFVTAVLFVIANRAAVHGYFDSDELDNLSFTREMDPADFVKAMVEPKFYENNFRPVGHGFFLAMGALAGLRFPAFVFAIQAIHLLNVCLLFLLLRRLGLSFAGCCAGALFFAFHMAVFDVYWKPMYVFDLLCASFCLVSFLLYREGHWALALLAMWVAYRAKEVAIALPAILALYEWLLGGRRMRRVIPFFALAAVIGVQVLAYNAHRDDAYTFRFTPAAVWTCIRFYSGQIFLIPYAGFAIFLLLAVRRDARIPFGLAAFLLFLTPMLLLPGRLFSAYLYVPLLGLAIAIGAFAAHVDPRLIAVFFLLWLPFNYSLLRQNRRRELTRADAARSYVTGLRTLTRAYPQLATFAYDGGPLTGYGVQAALKLVHAGSPVRLLTIDDPGLSQALRESPSTVLNWDEATRQLTPAVHLPENRDASFVPLGNDAPLWQLGNGWYASEGAYRWSRPTAKVRLWRPEGARRFELGVNIGPEYIAAVKASHVKVSMDGVVIGVHTFTHSGLLDVSWDLPAAPAGEVEVTLETSPPFEGERSLGVAVRDLGFAEPPRR